MKKLTMTCLALLLCGVTVTASAKESVSVSLFSWPGYGFWFIAKEKNLVPELELDISIIEDPYDSFAMMSAGRLDVTSSTVEYGPIAASQGAPVKLVAYTNPSYGTDKIIVGPQVKEASDLVGKQVAVMEGGLSQIFMGIWLEDNGVAIDQVKFVNLIMDDAVGALVGGTAAAGEYWEPFGSQVLANLKGARVVASSLEPYWQEQALLGDGMYMSERFISQRPEAAKLAMQAYFAAVDFWKENPAEANRIIAGALRFPVADVEAVIGATGEPHEGGIAVLDLPQAARLMGVLEGEPPLGLNNGQIRDHWALTSEWWKKFGLISDIQAPEAGIDFRPLTAVAGE